MEQEQGLGQNALNIQNVNELPQDEREEIVQLVFAARLAGGHATDGLHNFAYDRQTNARARSRGNRHAEIKLLLQPFDEPPAQGMQIVSELDPCQLCVNDLQDYVDHHQIAVNVVYLLDLDEGDPDGIRDFYVGYGLLAGGGDFIYTLPRE